MENSHENFVSLTDKELVEIDGGVIPPPVVAAIITGTVALTTWGYSKVQDYYYRKGYVDGYYSK